MAEKVMWEVGEVMREVMGEAVCNIVTHGMTWMMQHWCSLYRG